MAFTVKDFSDFFAAKKNGTFKCVFCGNETFTVNSFIDAKQVPPGESALLTIPASAGDVPPISHHQFYSFSCLNCGHTDFFHRIQIELWLKSKEIETPKTAEDGNG